MANPQPTPFVRFSKELFEAFYQNPPATVAACQLWLWVMRWTYADFGKDETKERPLRDIAEAVAMSRPTVCRELQSLVRARYLRRGENGGYAIQKDYDLWRADTKKRSYHFGAQGGQIKLEIGVKMERKTVSHGETKRFPRCNDTVSHGETIPFPTVKSTVSPCETPIRRENTVENKGEKGAQARRPQVLPNGKTDTARSRAELGHEDFPPEAHPSFAKMAFPIQTEFAKTWNDAREQHRKKNECRKGCGRDRASEAWPYCRPCTVCVTCDGGLDGSRKFQTGPRGVICTKCADDVAKEF